MAEVGKIKRELKQKGHVVDFYFDTVLLPDGRMAEWDFLKHGNAAAVVAVDPEGKILLVKQYRNPVDRYTLEIPAGCVDEGESMEDCARRELSEETGYAPGKLVHLFDNYTAISYSDELISIFAATDLYRNDLEADDDEFLSVERFELSEVIDMIKCGIIKDAKTIAGILGYKDMING